MTELNNSELIRLSASQLAAKLAAREVTSVEVTQAYLDRIAAIDNSTRKFVAQRKDPVSVGFAFSLGHSSVVILAGVMVVGGAGLVGQLMEDGTTGHLVLGLIGSGVSGLFLLAMGIFNVSAFLRTMQLYRAAQAGGTIATETGPEGTSVTMDLVA